MATDTNNPDPDEFPTPALSADGVLILPGHRAYDYYSMKPGVITMVDADGWFDFEHDDGTIAYLNGERICTLAHADKMGWK